MIYTVTFNPSLDYIVQVPDMQSGETNRTTRETLYPGGKGINVSIVLANLGVESRALGFSAGFTGRELERMLEKAACKTDFIHLPDGYTRINVKIKSAVESEINGQGPRIGQAELALLYTKLDDLKDGDILVLAGSIPNTLPSDIYETIMIRLRGKDIRLVVDATGELLKKALAYRPFLVKPNRAELGELFDRVLSEKQEVIHYAKELQRLGAENVLVSLGGEGAILAAADGRIYERKAPKGMLVNSVGAGDSMVAGFLAGYLSIQDYGQAFLAGLAAGSATAFQDWLAGRADVEKLLAEMRC